LLGVTGDTAGHVGGAGERWQGGRWHGGVRPRVAAAQVKLRAIAIQASQALLASTRGLVSERPVDEFGEDLLDHGVAAVVGFGLNQDERAVRERGAVAPHGEQLVLISGAVLSRLSVPQCGRLDRGPARHDHTNRSAMAVRAKG
jgi:hypothetical protein